MDSVLDRIGTSDSDTSDKDYQRPTKKISLKVRFFSRIYAGYTMLHSLWTLCCIMYPVEGMI